MSIINVLPGHMADLIAAGEVVERPASVVKELLENSFDAGATACTVEIRSGGMTYIRVSDNGCGMGREDAQTAFLRHATSKIRTPEDLDAIGTLGFRGEALAAVSAVAKVDMLTRLKGDAEGTSVVIEGGKMLSCDDAGCPEGTTIIVRDLFYNTPARLKFVKKDVTEASAVRTAVQNAALSHPEVSIKYIRDGKEELHTPGDGDLLSCVYNALGREFAMSLVKVGYTDDCADIQGFAVKPSACRGNRAMQHFFINGRYIRSAALTSALEAAYRNRAMIGKFPACVISMKLKLSGVDVNVHPAKTEVRLFEQKRVCDALYAAVMTALDDEGAPKKAEQPRLESRPKDDFFMSMTAQQFRSAPPKEWGVKSAAAFTPKRSPEREVPQQRRPDPVPKQLEKRLVTLRTPEEGYERLSGVMTAKESAVSREKVQPEAADRRAKPELPQEPAQQEIALPEVKSAKSFRVVGEVLKTYIVVETGEKLLLIDKHAAHERILFDRLTEKSFSAMSQTLLIPVTFTPEGDVFSALTDNLPLLREFGFEAEDFGGGSMVVRACPEYIDAEQAVPALEEIGEELVKRGRADSAYARNHIIATVACKAAIKAGRESHISELERVAEKVVSGEVKYCPHGRPVAVELTKNKLDKMFGRLG